MAAGYGHLEVIRDINLTVQAGEGVACIGAHGAGKTTTLRLAVDAAAGKPERLEAAYDVFPRLKQRRRQAVGTLSGGEQQMVAMARAILTQPRLLMIDEMSQGLAPTIVRQLFQMVDLFRQQGTAVLLVEQVVESALAVADRAYIFEHGSIAHEAA